MSGRCPRVDLHTKCPPGYLAWQDWAEHRSKTHSQRKCPGCGLYTIWFPKTISAKMLEVLGYIHQGKHHSTGCGIWSLSDAGGRANTLKALERRGLIEATGKHSPRYRITVEGFKALEAQR